MLLRCALIDDTHSEYKNIYFLRQIDNQGKVEARNEMNQMPNPSFFYELRQTIADFLQPP